MKKMARIAEIEAEIEMLKKQWPAHSLPPAMLMQLDELEDELDILLKEEMDHASQENTP
ncbi:MAG: histidine kinase [Chloroflexota bacterium]